MKVIKTKKEKEVGRVALILRMNEDLHSKLKKIAQESDTSLNHLVVKILETALGDKNLRIEI